MFSGTMDDGTEFRLADYAGKQNVVLYFYPRDATKGCTREACAFRDSYNAIRNHDAVLVGISSDTAESHRSFKQNNSLPFPLIADPKKEIIKAYDVIGSLGLLPTKRVTYLIDKSGIVRGIFRHELSMNKHRDDVLKWLEAND
ncbi:MAG: peroxiredoxin [Dehalococcoidia bacterium]|nr:peroxiredoxin [Dehalococcoidia bacterium]